MVFFLFPMPDSCCGDMMIFYRRWWSFTGECIIHVWDHGPAVQAWSIRFVTAL